VARSFAVVGGGIVGLATACALLDRFPRAKVTVLEKEARVGMHQSGNNSGVLHCGLYYAPGSLKAKLALAGLRKMVAFCRANAIAHEICGKIVVAVTEDEVPRLLALLERGRANGLDDLELLEPDAIRAIEPHVAGVKAIRVPQEGIADYPAVCEALARRIADRGGAVLTGARVVAMDHRADGWTLASTRGETHADYVITCAGLHADRVARLAGEHPRERIVPFRGEYFVLKKDREHLVRHLVYPVPDPRFPFLGVHFTRRVTGGVECGPNAVLAFAREGYTRGVIDPFDVADTLAFPGFWRFLAKHAAMSARELQTSLSVDAFARALQRLVPDVRASDLERPVAGEKRGAGVRAQAMTPEGDLVLDFSLLAREHALHVMSAPSPGATASLAIGEAIARAVAGEPVLD
jgi:L-2-hydroxyglutarate oxidase